MHIALVLDDIKRKDQSRIYQQEQEVSDWAARQEHRQWEESFPQGNEYRQWPPPPDRPDGNDQRNYADQADYCPHWDQTGVVIFDAGLARDAGHDEAREYHEPEDDGITSHADFEEKFIDIGVSEQMMEEVAEVEGSSTH